MKTKIDTMNHAQRAMFARNLYRRPSLRHNAATVAMLERLTNGGK